MSKSKRRPQAGRLRDVGGPLVSACLIVRDEEAVLAECLASLQGVADQIVVHDTGSTDSSVTIARTAGAHVIEGRWADDFAAARNVALAACIGTWILHIDADETVTGDRRALRRALQAAPANVDTFDIEIENLLDDGTGKSYSFKACRVFRRERGEWHGTIHEQVVARPEQRSLVASTRSLPARLIHSGYLSEHMARHGKLERNLRIASDAVGRDGAGAGDLLDLGRSLKAAGRLDEAIERCFEAADLGRGTHIEGAALHFAVSCLLGLGRMTEAHEAIARLRMVTESTAIPDFLEAQAELQAGNGERALELLRTIDDLIDDRGKRLGSAVLPLHIGMAQAICGRWAEAADAFIAAVVGEHAIPGNLGLLFDAMARSGRLVSRLDGLFDEANAAAVVKEAGKLATDPTVTPSVRFLAAAILTAAGDLNGPALVERAAPQLDGPFFTTALLELDALAPDLLPAFVPAAASTPERASAMAAALRELGADEAAATICAPA